jgi:hypothetical protein
MLSEDIINDKFKIQNNLNSDIINKISEIDYNSELFMDEIYNILNDNILINIEDIFSIIDIIHRNNKKINDHLYLELKNQKNIINDLSIELNQIKKSIIVNNKYFYIIISFSIIFIIKIIFI